MVGCIYRHFKGISIHASAKEATTVSSFSGVTEYFNPRLREGGDKEYLRNNGGKKNFNPRLREGGDVCTLQKLLSGVIFQSTPPRRRRHAEKVPDLQKKYFNPRLREGGDFIIKKGVITWQFQSTPPRRRRLLNLASAGAMSLISIHASAKEATYCSSVILPVAKFQSTPPRRRRQSPLLRKKFGHSKFQSTPPRRRRRGFRRIYRDQNHISIHASAKEATTVLQY